MSPTFSPRASASFFAFHLASQVSQLLPEAVSLPEKKMPEMSEY
ncbi:MAG: hypothetical protein AAF501_02010 [Pseudomonadota bacterium]